MHTSDLRAKRPKEFRHNSTSDKRRESESAENGRTNGAKAKRFVMHHFVYLKAIEAAALFVRRHFTKHITLMGRKKSI